MSVNGTLSEHQKAFLRILMTHYDSLKMFLPEAPKISEIKDDRRKPELCKNFSILFLDAFYGDITLLVVNARHMKNVPGKKTDMRDSEWISTLLRAGLLNGSFIPEKRIREFRDLNRYRKSVILHSYMMAVFRNDPIP